MICTRCAAHLDEAIVHDHLVAAHAMPADRLAAEASAIITGRDKDGRCVSCFRIRGHLQRCRLRPGGEPAAWVKPCGFCAESTGGKCSKHGGPDTMVRHREIAKEAQRRYRARLVGATR